VCKSWDWLIPVQGVLPFVYKIPFSELINYEWDKVEEEEEEEEC
jgi:hypothetical protein